MLTKLLQFLHKYLMFLLYYLQNILSNTFKNLYLFISEPKTYLKDLIKAITLKNLLKFVVKLFSIFKILKVLYNLKLINFTWFYKLYFYLNALFGFSVIIFPPWEKNF